MKKIFISLTVLVIALLFILRGMCHASEFSNLEARMEMNKAPSIMILKDGTNIAVYNTTSVLVPNEVDLVDILMPEKQEISYPGGFGNIRDAVFTHHPLSRAVSRTYRKHKTYGTKKYVPIDPYRQSSLLNMTRG